MAISSFFPADVEVHAVGPDVDVALAGQRPLTPGVVVLLPGGLEPGDGRRRQVGGVDAEDRPEGLGEVAGADALEVEPGDQLVQALGPPQVGGQDGGGEPLALLGWATVLDPGLLDRDRADARLDGPLGEVAVADHLAASGLIPEVGAGVDPGGDLGLDGLGEHASRPVAEDLGKDILALGQGHDPDVGGRLLHGGVLLGLVGQRVCS
jgi:hypothetical protein